ncbi:hypothetical protein NFX39_02195 [Fructobacillus sp. W13]|uniref:Uncharacterized protein n=1 Tax=Fructobacillus apis TaxID=2935017 RepID=A0ABT0ZPH8_9LACO|nr:hypothetical protein [Fructobacillus apis]MCO0831906.1 hypothetical protein [Fructobacillus apis]
MNNEKWFYIFDETSKRYLHAVKQMEQPENSTAIDPSNVMFAKWDELNGCWKSDEEELKNFNEVLNQNNSNPVQERMATIVKSTMTQMTAQNVRITKLETLVKQLTEGGAK